MQKQLDIPEDLFSNNFDVQLSQIVMKIFWVGYLAGKKELADDYDATDKPLNVVVNELQDKLIELKGKGQDLTNMLNENKDLQKSEKANLNLTPNHKKINKQHDVIVRELLNKLDREMKTVKSNIVSKTKERVVKK